MLVGAELASEISDVDIHDIGLGIVLVAPHGREDLLPRDSATVAHQMDQQVELGAGQPNQRPGAVYFAREQTRLDVAHAQRCRGSLRGKAQLSAHPGGQLREREGLDQIVDGARIETRDAILDLTPRGEHDHRYRHPGLAQRAEDLHASAAGKHQVEHDQIEALLQGATFAFYSIQGRLHREPLGLQATGDEVDDPGLVLDQENHRSPPTHRGM